MNPDVWGPQLWTALHSITFSYPDKPTHKDQQDNRSFLYSLGKVLPCPGCQEEYNKYIMKNPPILHDKVLYVEWMIDLHNNINRRLDKKERSKEYVLNKYKNMYNTCITSLLNLNNNWSHPINLAVLVLVLVVILYFINKKYKLL